MPCLNWSKCLFTLVLASKPIIFLPGLPEKFQIVEAALKQCCTIDPFAKKVVCEINLKHLVFVFSSSLSIQRQFRFIFISNRKDMLFNISNSAGS